MHAINNILAACGSGAPANENCAQYATSSFSMGAWILLGVLIAAIVAAWKGKGRFRFTAIMTVVLVIGAGAAWTAMHGGQV